MPQVSPDFTRSMVKALFVTTCLLSIVSWYTTEQGMALYLSVWFAVIASLGVQGALVFVAWLIGLVKSRRALLGAVYAITACIPGSQRASAPRQSSASCTTSSASRWERPRNCWQRPRPKRKSTSWRSMK
jgi:hypothetical protein